MRWLRDALSEAAWMRTELPRSAARRAAIELVINRDACRAYGTPRAERPFSRAARMAAYSSRQTFIGQLQDAANSRSREHRRAH